ncbi:MAG: DUF4230 domain-containing protein [Phycisphaerales bacterium JB039]
MLESVILVFLLVILVAALAFGAGFILRRRAGQSEMTIRAQMIAQRVRTVGRLVGLEVFAKEIATATKGWAWLPPLVLSQAKLAMIFNFEKQYWIDLSRLSDDDVESLGEGKYRIHLPPLESNIRLTDVVPYDIQAGKALGLVDVIPMNAERQKALMSQAQEQARELFAGKDETYGNEAMRSIGRQLRSLLALFDIQVEILWREAEPVEGLTVGERAQKLIGVA